MLTQKIKIKRLNRQRNYFQIMKGIPSSYSLEDIGNIKKFLFELRKFNSDRRLHLVITLTKLHMKNLLGIRSIKIFAEMLRNYKFSDNPIESSVGIYILLCQSLDLPSGLSVDSKYNNLIRLQAKIPKLLYVFDKYLSL